MKKLIVGNWKMYAGPLAEAKALATNIAQYSHSLPSTIEIVLSPPALFTSTVSNIAAGTTVVTVSAQDCSVQPQKQGAFTGDISAPMLKDAGVDYVIVGHSERRQYHHETSADVCKKAEAAVASGLKPIICIGETADQRASGKAMEIVGKQVGESLPKTAKSGNFVLAYEPVWAIGSGQTPTADDIRQMHAYIKRAVSGITGIKPEQIQVLYGGSVKAANAREILSVEGVNGVLVGGASLDAEEFRNIIDAAK